MNLRKVLFSFLGVALAAMDSGCSTVAVRKCEAWNPAVTKEKALYQAANDAYTATSPATTLEKRTVWVSFWGLNQTNVNASNCLGPGLAEVKVHTNLGFALITVATLGFFQPMTVEWRCAREPQAHVRDF
jgi:hypothetical protein